MKTVVITDDVILGDKAYYAGEAVVSDAEATALDDANLITGSPVEYTPFQDIEVPVDHVAPIGTTSAITAVPGSFADVAAVQTYLAAAGGVPRIEARLDAVEAKIDETLSGLEDAGIFATA